MKCVRYYSFFKSYIMHSKIERVTQLTYSGSLFFNTIYMLLHQLQNKNKKENNTILYIYDYMIYILNNTILYIIIFIIVFILTLEVETEYICYSCYFLFYFYYYI